MNKVIMTGNFVADPEMKATQDGKSIAKFRIAVKRRGKEDKSDFFSLVAWYKTAEFIEKYMKKGTRVLVLGRLQNDEYTANDGTKKSFTQIVVDEIEFAGGKTEPAPQAKSGEDFVQIPDNMDEQLPFTF